MIKLVECPRDAMQGIKPFIPTALKIEYINTLLDVGFDTLDFGSFVSHKHIPQMADTVEVLNGLNLENTKTKLLAIIAYVRGAEEAAVHEQINYLGFPFSISETFQVRNTNSTIEQSLVNVEKIQQLCILSKKELVVYVSMGFGNPYGDAWSPEVAISWVNRLAALGVKIISMSDTVGVGNPESISYLFKNLIPAFPNIEFGAHLHTHSFNWEEKVKAAHDNGCNRFDGAMKGYGGCPMAADDLVGNMPTENLLQFFKAELKDINWEALENVNKVVDKVFLSH